MPADQVSVVLPIFTDKLSQDELLSLEHLATHLSDYPVSIVAPESLPIGLPYPVERFDTQFFSSVSSYSRLMLSREFYTRFSHFQYILIYQLDCLVFSSKLEGWCAADYDYIGAPWFKDENNPNKGFSRVGNGGFSLRRVSAFLDVLESRRYLDQHVPIYDDLMKPVYEYRPQPNPGRRLLNRLRVLRRVRQGVDWYLANYTINEDRFWSDRAFFFDPEFRVAPVAEGLHFSFERYPRYCYEQNGHQLPFGCHAWAKWDRQFWEPFLIN
jgi:hypothetical protein